MRRGTIGLAMLVLVLSGAFALSACGDDDSTTVDETTTVEEAATTSDDTDTTTTTPTTTTSTSTTTDETTPGGAVVPAVPDCEKGEIYSEGSKACVPIGSGSNPCPEGEVPAADQPSCIKE